MKDHLLKLNRWITEVNRNTVYIDKEIKYWGEMAQDIKNEILKTDLYAQSQQLFKEIERESTKD